MCTFLEIERINYIASAVGCAYRVVELYFDQAAIHILSVHINTVEGDPWLKKKDGAFNYIRYFRDGAFTDILKDHQLESTAISRIHNPLSG